jgi:hypothetical protein
MKEKRLKGGFKMKEIRRKINSGDRGAVLLVEESEHFGEYGMGFSDRTKFWTLRNNLDRSRTPSFFLKNVVVFLAGECPKRKAGARMGGGRGGNRGKGEGHRGDNGTDFLNTDRWERLRSISKGIPVVATLGLEMGILGQTPQDLESRRIETDSDGVQKVITLIERIERSLRMSSIYFCLFVSGS